MSPESRVMSPRRTGRLLFRLVKWVCLLFLIIGLSAFLFTYFQVKPLLEQREDDLQNEVGQRTARLVKDFVDSRLAVLHTLSASPAMSNMNYDFQREYILNLLHFDWDIYELSVADSQGREQIRAFQSGLVLKGSMENLSAEPFFIESIKGLSYAGEPYFSEARDAYQRLSVPIIKEGKAVGVLTVVINLFPISKELSSIKVGNSGISYVVSRDGLVIAHPYFKQLPPGVSLIDRAAVKNVMKGKPVKAFEKESFYINEGGKEVVASAFLLKEMGRETGTQARGAGVGVIVEREVSEALAFFWLLVRIMAITAAGSAAVLLIFMFAGSRRILKPLTELHEGAMALGAGNLGYRVNIKSGDELEALGESFNNMAGRLQNAMNNLSDSEFRFRAIVENMGEGLILMDKERTIIYVNPAYARLTGYTQQDFVGKKAGSFTLEREEQEKIAKELSVRKKGMVSTYEVYLKHKNGEKIPVLVSGAPIFDASSNFQNSIAIFTDLREVKKFRLEMEKLARLAAMGEMSAAVSHEFKNSLGAINNSLYFLLTKLSNADDKIRKHLYLMRQSVYSSNNFIADLLEYAHPKEPSFSEVELNSSIEEVLAMINISGRARISTELDPALPPVKADPDMLRRVLLNLILNAVDAVSNNDGVIKISTAISDGYAEACIRDTGPGISSEGLARIFEPFYTTKTKGTGLGLHISKQIMEKHGGEIRVESEPGKGSTFVVRLPLSGSKAQAAISGQQTVDSR